MIRTYTGSEFDHAALIIKFASEPDDVFFLEATSNMGVMLKHFGGMKHTMGNFYSKIAIRKLDWDRENDCLNIVEQFLK